MKHIRSLALSVALALPAAAGAQSLTYTDYGPNRGSRAVALEAFGASLAESGIDLSFFWGGSLVGGKATLQGLSDGVADMGSIVGFFTPKQLQLYAIGDLPVENSDVWVGMKAIHELARTDAAMKAEFDAAGVHYVSTFSTTPVQLICRPEITSLEQLKGLKVRASGPYGDALADLGAEVVRMSQADVYQSLDSGLLDCNQNYYYAILSYKQYEVAKNILALDWGQNMSFGIFMNKASYDALSPEAQAAIDAAGDAFIDTYAEALITGIDGDRAMLSDGIDGHTVNIITLDDAGAQTLGQASAAQIDAWKARVAENGADGAAVMDRYQEIIAKYADTLAADGYPWNK